jgi:hypothetical protein
MNDTQNQEQENAENQQPVPQTESTENTNTEANTPDSTPAPEGSDVESAPETTDDSGADPVPAPQEAAAPEQQAASDLSASAESTEDFQGILSHFGAERVDEVGKSDSGEIIYALFNAGGTKEYARGTYKDLLEVTKAA